MTVFLATIFLTGVLAAMTSLERLTSAVSAAKTEIASLHAQVAELAAKVAAAPADDSPQLDALSAELEGALPDPTVTVAAAPTEGPPTV